MKRTLLLLLALATTAGIVGALASASTGSEPTISSGSPVERDSFPAQDQWLLETIGATGAITKIGALGGAVFYSSTNDQGGQCFMAGSDPGVGLSGGCFRGSARLEQPLVDMSGIGMNPADGSFRLARVEGIAADGVAAVGVIDAEGILHTTPVIDNVYRMSPDELPSDQPRAIVALDASGAQVFVKSLD